MRDLKQLEKYFKDNDLVQDGYYLGTKTMVKQIGFYEETSGFCCGMPEFGEFALNKELDKHWPALLEYYIQTAKRPFFICTTLTLKMWSGLNKALEEVGFERRSLLKPNGGGRYKIIVWEYIRK